MKIFLIILAMSIFSSNSFAGELYEYTDSTVENEFVEKNAISYLADYNVSRNRITVSNIERVYKSTKKVNIGRIDSYLFTADVYVKDYGKMRGLFYICNGASINAKYNMGEVFMATVGNMKQEEDYEKFFIEYKRMVQNNTSAALVALELYMM